MKNQIKHPLFKVALVLFYAALISTGCKKEMPANQNDAASLSNSPIAARKAVMNVVNLVSDVEEYNPIHIDANLVNAWGMAFGPTGGIWVSAADKGLSTIYDKTGNTLRPPVGIPLNGDPRGAAPTGQVFNPTSAFVIPASGAVSKFIFATENGTIAAWAGGDTATTVARASDDAVYKGIELASDNGSWFLYVTDFHNGKIDVLDQNFNYVHKSFTDPNIPAGFAPFNIRLLGGKLYVTYAKQLAPDNEDDEAGPGNGYVDIFNTDGSFVRRFTSKGPLNSPWGLEVLRGKMDDEQGDYDSQGDERIIQHDDLNILVGNFGDGHINVYSSSGQLKGQLKMHGKAIEIEGLWALSYPPQNNSAYSTVSNWLYFTAGPDDEEHGVFGFIVQ